MKPRSVYVALCEHAIAERASSGQVVRFAENLIQTVAAPGEELRFLGDDGAVYAVEAGIHCADCERAAAAGQEITYPVLVSVGVLGSGPVAGFAQLDTATRKSLLR